MRPLTQLNSFPITLTILKFLGVDLNNDLTTNPEQLKQYGHSACMVVSAIVGRQPIFPDTLSSANLNIFSQNYSNTFKKDYYATLIQSTQVQKTLAFVKENNLGKFISFDDIKLDCTYLFMDHAHSEAVITSKNHFIEIEVDPFTFIPSIDHCNTFPIDRSDLGPCTTIVEITSIPQDIFKKAAKIIATHWKKKPYFKTIDEIDYLPAERNCIAYMYNILLACQQLMNGIQPVFQEPNIMATIPDKPTSITKGKGNSLKTSKKRRNDSKSNTKHKLLLIAETLMLLFACYQTNHPKTIIRLLSNMLLSFMLKGKNAIVHSQNILLTFFKSTNLAISSTTQTASTPPLKSTLNL